MRTVWTGAAIGLAGIIAGLLVALFRPGDPAASVRLRQEDPDQLVDSAFAALEAGAPGRIADLLYADSPEMRTAMNELGALFEALAAVSRTIERRFPVEVAELRENAAAGQTSLLTSLMGTRRQPDRQGPGLVRAALADPFGWLQRARGRVEARSMGADVAGLYVDGAPLAGLPLTLKREDGRWWVVLPLKLPVVSRYAPRTPEEWLIVASMARSIRNAVADLDSDLARGEGDDLDDAARLAGEKAVAPIAMCFFAYQRALDLRED